jgi:hypothetical protein
MGGARVVLARKQISSVVDGQGRVGQIRRFVESREHHTNGASVRHIGDTLSIDSNVFMGQSDTRP